MDQGTKLQKRALASGLALLGGIALMVPGVAAAASDHLACFKVKDSASRGTFTVTLGTAGVAQTCRAKVPASIACLPSSQQKINPTPPGGGPSGTTPDVFLCYQLKCSRPLPPALQLEDQFGRRAVAFRGGKWLCAPTAVIGVAPTTTTTTTTLPGGGCNFANGQCLGSCPAGGKCGVSASGASCECRTVSCGDSDAPSCDGFCPTAGEACIFNLTGCSCVRIP